MEHSISAVEELRRLTAAAPADDGSRPSDEKLAALLADLAEAAQGMSDRVFESVGSAIAPGDLMRVLLIAECEGAQAGGERR